MDYDVIIVGARVGGSVLAALLGQSGHRVLVLDKTHFPSDTLSTHFFRGPALRVFERLNVLDEVRAAAPPMATQWSDIDGQVIRDPVDGVEEHLRFFLCERRITLDWILFRRVSREQNVEIRQGAHVKDLIWEDGRAVGVTWRQADGEGEARARVVVGADGFYSTLARLLQPKVEAQSPVQRCMYYTYFWGLEPLEQEALAEHHFLQDSLTYVFPTDADLTLVAVSVPISEFPSFKREPLRRLQAHLGLLPRLAPRLAHAQVAAEVKGAGNIPCFQRMPYGPGWALVGDAQQVMDPWSGMGIDHAATHAGLLADALHTFLQGNAPWDATMTDYRTRARAWSEKSYRRTSTYAADLRPMTRAALERRGLI
jgi:2-polyprenyl-6-methoxyphenol hydroxylase-like FAD-dependent oxidoreductase